MQKKSIIAAFAAAGAMLSTPAMAADAYSLKNAYGAEIHVLEMTQSEAREIMRPEIKTQSPEQDITLQESYRLKVLFNRHFNRGAYKIAKEQGYDNNRAQSLANALTYIYGRYLVEKDKDMTFQPFEFNPNVSKPVNGFTPSSITASVRAGNGEQYLVCGIATPDKGFTTGQWYEGFTGQKINDYQLPPVYAKYMREETLWHERSHCFSISQEDRADYYAVLQLLNEYHGTEELHDVVSYLRFKSQMWMYSADNKYVVGADYVGAVTLAALEDFQQQDRKMSKEEIWAMASALITMDGEPIEDAMPRWQAINAEHKEAAIQSQSALVRQAQPQKMAARVTYSGFSS